MNIKDRIEKIIEDYSYAVDEARVRNNIKRTYKGKPPVERGTIDIYQEDKNINYFAI